MILEMGGVSYELGCGIDECCLHRYTLEARNDVDLRHDDDEDMFAMINLKNKNK